MQHEGLATLSMAHFVTAVLICFYLEEDGPFGFNRYCELSL